MPRRPRPKLVPQPRLRTEADYERVREELDAFMLANPNTADLVRRSPLSEKYKNDPLRPGRTRKALLR